MSERYTVAQLIEELQKIPGDTAVMTAGYEGGFCDLEVVSVHDVILDVHDKWNYGPHEVVSDRSARGRPDKVIKAVLL